MAPMGASAGEPGACSINAGGGALASGVDLTFATHFAASLESESKSKTPPAIYSCQWSFDSDIRKRVRRNGMRMLESDHSRAIGVGRNGRCV